MSIETLALGSTTDLERLDGRHCALSSESTNRDSAVAYQRYSARGLVGLSVAVTEIVTEPIASGHRRLSGQWEKVNNTNDCDRWRRTAAVLRSRRSEVRILSGALW